MIRDPLFWVIPLLIQIVSYAKILKKMGKRSAMAIVPFLGEMEMAYDLFRYRRTYWRQAVVAVCLLATAEWIGTDNSYGLALKAAALTVYGVFLIRLYFRLSKQFGRGFGFFLGLVTMPLIFLPVLAFGKSAYLGRPEFKEEKERSPLAVWLKRTGFVLVSVAELAVLLAVCFGLATLLHPARPIAEYMLRGDLNKMESVTDTAEVVGRNDTLGADHAKIVKKLRSRDYFFPDHSGDKKVVVMEYIIGSDLEDDRGCASVNISQMMDATEKGDGLEFVIQAGGSDRWFTKGIDDLTVGRYTISGGELETAQMLDDTLCMSEPENLSDFIRWAKENYPADRYMLVLWDHGGGFASGYGADDINDREDGESLMSASEIIDAVKDADMRFDLIGFDACLMQNIEYANAFEPYADYYLASQETEPAYGWFYTSGFGKLAEDPTLGTEEFGRMIVSSYDQLYRTMNDGNPKPENTLSLVDLTLVKPVYQQLTDIYDDVLGKIKDSPVVFANISAARSKSYAFQDKEQVDLINFLTGLKKADYRQQVALDEDLDKLCEAVNACVVYRNKDSAEGINGISIDFPYDDLYMYDMEYEQLKAVKYKTEESFFNTFCSIMAAQQMSRSREEDSFLSKFLTPDYTYEKWYVDGFDDYDTSDLFIDIPVRQTGGAYLPELPDKTWDTVLDVTTAAYMDTEDGLMYIGRVHIDAGEEEGHPLIGLSDRWASVNGHLVCYETQTPIETDEGTVFKGTIDARLNDTENITLHVEWDPVKEGAEYDEDYVPEGRVTGYSRDTENTLFFMRKGLEQFKTGDRIDFLFDIYDEEGKIKDTKTYGSTLTVLSDERLTVKDLPFEDGTELEYYGMLTDVYQRELITEAIRERVSDQ